MPFKDPVKKSASLKKYNNKPERKEHLRKRHLWVNHKMTIEDFNNLWNDQKGCCYLCEKPMIETQVVIDHDHSCCPKGKSCERCRRGLADRLCNLLVGYLNDDPTLLQRLVDNLTNANKRLGLSDWI